MTTVMQWGNSEGIKGRCDAKCHNATCSDCECMCGGRFHGKGKIPGALEEAVRQFGEEVIKEAERRAKAEGVEVEFYPLLVQRGLFE